MKRLLIIWAALGAAMATVIAPASAESKREKAEELIVKAADTVSYFAKDSAFEPLWDAADDAKAMVIIPKSLRGGFIIGASGGNAVMVAKNPDGSWSEPTFFTVGSLSIGFQAGFEGSETILLVMTQRGMEHLLSTTVKLGADLSIAAGPVGAGAKAQTVDVLAFSRSRGLYGGVSLEGAVLKSRGSWNREYYQANITPADVIYRERVSRPQSAVLQNAVWALAHRDQPGARPAMMAPVRPTRIDPVTGDPLPEEPRYDDDAVYGAPLDPIENQ
ncbi:lipid-binding SYLF domain-containing protein [Hyphococcus sp.]|uniref:lipid-binding SYLF domain-containing protein n=1 Tax=Hyphococcus sp. TaxID=2038636 RepID=UPI003CCBA019